MAERTTSTGVVLRLVEPAKPDLVSAMIEEAIFLDYLMSQVQVTVKPPTAWKRLVAAVWRLAFGA